MVKSNIENDLKGSIEGIEYNSITRVSGYSFNIVGLKRQRVCFRTVNGGRGCRGGRLRRGRAAVLHHDAGPCQNGGEVQGGGGACSSTANGWGG